MPVLRMNSIKPFKHGKAQKEQPFRLLTIAALINTGQVWRMKESREKKCRMGCSNKPNGDRRARTSPLAEKVESEMKSAILEPKGETEEFYRIKLHNRWQATIP